MHIWVGWIWLPRAGRVGGRETEVGKPERKVLLRVLLYSRQEVMRRWNGGSGEGGGGMEWEG